MKGTTNAQRNAIIDSTSAVDSLTLTKADGTTQKHTVSNIIPKDGAPTEGSSKFVTSGAIYTALQGRVPVESGKGLSTNDYTDPEKSKVSNLPANANTTFATKTELTDALSSVYKYKGSVNTYGNLPSNATAGDVYNVVASYNGVPAGTNWAWNGSSWDALGGTVTGYVADTTTVNGKPLSSNVTLAAADVSAVPTTRTVNGKALSSDISLTASDVGALASGGTAARATADASGNNIVNTYATKTELTNGLAGKQNALTFDSAPTSGSSNPVTSGGVYSAINSKVDKTTQEQKDAEQDGKLPTGVSTSLDSDNNLTVGITQANGSVISDTVNLPVGSNWTTLWEGDSSDISLSDGLLETLQSYNLCRVTVKHSSKYTMGRSHRYYAGQQIIYCNFKYIEPLKTTLTSHPATSSSPSGIQYNWVLATFNIIIPQSSNTSAYIVYLVGRAYNSTSSHGNEASLPAGTLPTTLTFIGIKPSDQSIISVQDTSIIKIEGL